MIHKLADEGKLSEDMVVTLPQLAAGQKKGRESQDELCVCATYGIGSVDVAVANQNIPEHFHFIRRLNPLARSPLKPKARLPPKQGVGTLGRAVSCFFKTIMIK